jgi:hypothetical protein
VAVVARVQGEYRGEGQTKMQEREDLRSFPVFEITFLSDLVKVGREFGRRILDAGDEDLEVGIVELWRHPDRFRVDEVMNVSNHILALEFSGVLRERSCVVGNWLLSLRTAKKTRYYFEIVVETPKFKGRK